MSVPGRAPTARGQPVPPRIPPNRGSAGQQPARVAAAPAGQAAKGAGRGIPVGGKQTFIVYTTHGKDDTGIRTLVGEYVESGTNHGRKVYKKAQTIPGHETVSVFLYFWDERDGPDFTGWWFGNKVGGAQVWSRNVETGIAPPKAGWTIPWDGDVREDLMVVNAAEKQSDDKKLAQSRLEARKAEETSKLTAATAAEWEERVQQATEKAADAEMDVNETIEEAKKEVEDGDQELPEEERVAMATTKMEAQAKALQETQRAIALEGIAAARAPPALKAEISQLNQRMKGLQDKLKTEVAALKKRVLLKKQEEEDKAKEEEEDLREREMEGTHFQQLEEMRPAAIDKVQAAEDEVEKAAIAAAPLQIETADDLRPVMLEAIRETEQRVRAATMVIGEARRYISSKLSIVSTFVKSVKTTAVEEFTELQKKLNEAQTKLTPYKSVRQDYEQRVQAKKLYEELSAKLVGAEIEVEKAAMMTAPLGADSADGIKETEATLTAAQSALAQTTRLIDSKLRSAEKNPGPIKDEIQPLQERCKQAQEKLDEVRKTVKETQIRIAADTLLREVSEKVSSAEEELQKMAEAELPFLRSDTKGHGLSDLISSADIIASKVHAALAEAQTFVARKLVEVARFSEGPGKTVKEEIDMLQKRLEEGRERLAQFKSSLADRKRTHLLEEAEKKIATAEADMDRMREVAQGLANMGGVGEPMTENLTEALEQARSAERAAQASAVNARKELIVATGELKKLALSGSGSGSELGKLTTRVNNIHTDINKLKNGVKDAEERVRVKQDLAEVLTRLQMAESDVDKICASSVSEEQPAPEAVERMEKATISAHTKITTTAKLVDVKLKAAQGFQQAELKAMRARIAMAEKKLNDSMGKAKEQKERLRVSELTAQAVEKVEAVHSAVQKTSDAELPFLKGIEALAPNEALTAIAACEAAASMAQKAIKEARTFIVEKLAEAKEFSEAPSQSCTKELLALQKKVDTDAQKLAESKKDTAERKRKSQMQASGEKISGVEAAVQKLSSAMANFSDEKMEELTKEEAGAACAEISGAERGAKAAVDDARKFLAQRVQEAKSFSESLRGPVTAELGKLQQRLTQCQVTLAKLSSGCKEREQKFVARKLVQDAEVALEELQQDIEAAVKLAVPLQEEDTSQFLRAAYVQTMVGCLRKMMATSGEGSGEVFSRIAKGGAAKAADFMKFVEGLPELSGNDEVSFTSEQAAAMFATITGDKSVLAAADFQALLRDRSTCVASATLVDKPGDGKEIGSIETGEGVEIIALKEDNDGNKWAQCRLLRDASSAWVLYASSDGSSDFSESSSTGQMQSIGAYVKAVHARCGELCQAADRKLVDLVSHKQGPLAEVKSKLQEIRAKLGQEQSRATQLKKQVGDAITKVESEAKKEMHGVVEAKWRAMGEKSVQDGTATVEAAEATATEFITRAKATSSQPSLTEIEAVMKDKEATLKTLATAKGSIAQSMAAREKQKPAMRAILLEAHLQLQKLKHRVEAAETKCETQIQALKDSHTKMVKSAIKQVRSVIQAEVARSGKSLDDIFAELSKGSGEISADRFSSFVMGLSGHSMSDELVALAHRQIAPNGMRKLGFLKAIQEYGIFQCSIPLTESADAEASTTLRKMEKGELFELLEAPAESADAQVQRVRGRAYKDGLVGWVTLKDAQGKISLKRRDKPFMCVVKEVPLQSRDRSETFRTLQRDEVLELLEGPQEEKVPPELLLRVRMSSDGTEGWLTLRDSEGAEAAASSKTHYVCQNQIALTNALALKSCKAIAKIVKGDLLEALDDGEVKLDGEVKRMRLKNTKDGREGWATLEGKKTSFIVPSTSHYVVSKEVSLHEDWVKGSAVVRQLASGEAFEALEPPKEVMQDSKKVLRARTVEDSKTGWIFFTGGHLRPWSGNYVCQEAVSFTKGLADPEASGGRQAEPGQKFETIDGPAVDPPSKRRRIRFATAADGLLGWATLRAEDGRAFLAPA